MTTTPRPATSPTNVTTPATGERTAAPTPAAMSIPRCPAPQALAGRSNPWLTAPTRGHRHRSVASLRPATNATRTSASTAKTGGGNRRMAVTSITVPCEFASRCASARFGGEPPFAGPVDNLYTGGTSISVGEFACSRSFGAIGPHGEEPNGTPGPRQPPRQKTTTQRRRQWPL